MFYHKELAEGKLQLQLTEKSSMKTSNLAEISLFFQNFKREK